MVDPRCGGLGDDRLCVIGDAEASLSDHREIVRTVAHGEGFMRLQSEFVSQMDKRIELGLPAEDRFGHAARQLAIGEDQAVRLIGIEADRMGDALREEGEAA